MKAEREGLSCESGTMKETQTLVKEPPKAEQMREKYSGFSPSSQRSGKPGNCRQKSMRRAGSSSHNTQAVKWQSRPKD